MMPSAAGLDAIMKPRSVAVIGATEREGSVGAAVMRNLLDAGFVGPILPVNPRRPTVFGKPAVAKIADAFEQIRAALTRHRPDARFDGVRVQRMINRSQGLELLVGVERDATFGPIVLVSAGGTAVEVLGDRAIELAPLNKETAERLVRSLRISSLLDRFRGRPALNTDALLDVIVRFSRMITDLDNIQEAEANPVLVTPEEAVVFDARVIVTAPR